jgi:anaerobic carbon-monoxide dehydrogenase catalytic subunit
MEYIQKKTADRAVERFLPKASEKGISLVWDRYEGQIPVCGFGEAGLCCVDCLQGPCISHPFRDSSKMGVCGKDKDAFASQSLLRLVLHGTTTCLDQVSDFSRGVEAGEITPKNKARTDQILKEIRLLLVDGGKGMKKEFPKSMVHRWEEAGIFPEGIAGDLFKASRQLDGGVGDGEETLLRAFKASLLGCMARRLQGSLKKAVFGNTVPTRIEVNLGILNTGLPTILLYGHISPILKGKIAEEAKKKKVCVMGVCTDPILPPHRFPPVTSFGSQEIPLMTGAVDLIVAGDHWVNPSLPAIAKEWDIPVVPTGGWKNGTNRNGIAAEIVEKARKSFDIRGQIPRDVPEVRESAVMGFSPETVNMEKILKALTSGAVKGVAILSGSNNVKYSQDREIVGLAQEFLKNDILCVSEGEASVSLAKYGFLNPDKNDHEIGKGLSALLPSLGKEIPSVLDFGSSENGGVTDFLLSMAHAGKKDPREVPVRACFAEANRSSEAAEALWMVAMGVPTYFWPALPVTGSLKTMASLSRICGEKFGSGLFIPTEKKMEPQAKAKMIINDLEGKKAPRLAGYDWK